MCLNIITALLGAVDSIPLLGEGFELIGLFVTVRFILANVKKESREVTVMQIEETATELGVERIKKDFQIVVEDGIETGRALRMMWENYIRPEEKEEEFVLENEMKGIKMLN